MLLSFNRKSIGNWKQILINWCGIFYRKSKFWNHLSLTGFSELLICKSLSFDNLSSDLHVLIFWLECDTSGTESLYIAQISLKLGDQPWRYGILWYRTVIWNYKLSTTSLVEDNSFSQFHIFVICSISASTLPKTAWKLAIGSSSLSEQAAFSKMILVVSVCMVNFKIT